MTPFRFTPRRPDHRWLPYTRYRLLMAFKRMKRRPFCVSWMTNYDISRTLRANHYRKRFRDGLRGFPRKLRNA